MTARSFPWVRWFHRTQGGALGRGLAVHKGCAEARAGRRGRAEAGEETLVGGMTRETLQTEGVVGWARAAGCAGGAAVDIGKTCAPRIAIGQVGAEGALRRADLGTRRASARRSARSHPCWPGRAAGLPAAGIGGRAVHGTNGRWCGGDARSSLTCPSGAHRAGRLRLALPLLAPPAGTALFLTPGLSLPQSHEGKGSAEGQRAEKPGDTAA